MKTIQTFIAISVVFLLVLSVNGLQAQPQGKGNLACAKGIPDLSEEQQAKIDKIHVDLAKETLPLKNLLNEKKAHLKTLTSAEKVNETEVNATIDEIGKLKTDIMKKQTASRLEIRNLLNEEQRVMFDMRRGGPHGGGKGKMHRGGHNGNNNGNGCCNGQGGCVKNR